ncbi:MAG: hypothetical protein PHX68_03605, partial [Alphaproteobacteria bacterium]|nr:hypothetical protein [Alphaproteobacteria bacterium]
HPMKKTLFLIGCLFFAALLAFLMTERQRSERLLDAYKRQYAFPVMSYQSAGQPLGGGLILHQVRFGLLPAQHRVGQMLLRFDADGTQVVLRDVVVSVSDTLRAKYGHHLPEHFKAYRAPRDIFLKPLDTLAFLGIDAWRGDVRIRVEKAGKSARVRIEFWQQNLPQASVRLNVAAPAQSDHVFGFLTAPVQSVDIQIDDARLLQAFVAAAPTMGVPEAQAAAAGPSQPFRFSRAYPDSDASVQSLVSF